jgi:hypothetical protein
VDFDTPNLWHITNTSNSANWQYDLLGDNGVLKANEFGNQQIGIENWFVSPILNAQYMDSLSMVFRYAYAGRIGRTDRLQVLLSINCGQDYQYVLFDRSGEGLNGTTYNQPYFPFEEEEWKEVFIDLNEYLIWGEFRIAFVFTSGNGNNLFLDDIEFFNTGNPNQPRFEVSAEVYPNPASSNIFVSFDLPTHQDVTINLYDVYGRRYQSLKYQELLNHTVKLNVFGLSGLFLLTIEGEDFYTVKKVIIQK